MKRKYKVESNNHQFFNDDYEDLTGTVRVNEDVEIEKTFYYLVRAAVIHRISQLDKNMIYNSEDFLGINFSDAIECEVIFAEFCFEHLIQSGQVPVQMITRHDNNDRKYVIL